MALALVRLLFSVGSVGSVCAACARVLPDSRGTDAAAIDAPSILSLATCPEGRPKEGEPCTHPRGTTCAYGSCASYAVCTDGTWRVAPSATPPTLCPSLVPEEGAACDACFEDGGTCTYGDPTCGDASANAALARCRAGKFSVRVVTCVVTTVDSGPVDAGDADAGRDAADSGG